MDPWSKGDYSRHIREASMVVEKLPEINPPSGRVSGRGLMALSIFRARRQRNREVFHDAGFSSRVSWTRGKNRAQGGTRGGAHLPGALVARPAVGPCHQGAWEVSPAS